MNNKGQAFVEGLVLGSILLLSLFFILHYTLSMQNSFLIDELIEQSLICEFENSKNCSARLKAQLEELQFRNIMIQIKKDKNKVSLNLNAVSAFGRTFEKESELELDLSFKE